MSFIDELKRLNEAAKALEPANHPLLKAAQKTILALRGTK